MAIMTYAGRSWVTLPSGESNPYPPPTAERAEEILAEAKAREKAAREARIERERVVAEKKAAHALGLKALHLLAEGTQPELAGARLQAAKALMAYGVAR